MPVKPLEFLRDGLSLCIINSGRAQCFQTEDRVGKEGQNRAAEETWPKEPVFGEDCQPLVSSCDLGGWGKGQGLPLRSGNAGVPSTDCMCMSNMSGQRTVPAKPVCGTDVGAEKRHRLG